MIRYVLFVYLGYFVFVNDNVFYISVLINKNGKDFSI